VESDDAYPLLGVADDGGCERVPGLALDHYTATTANANISSSPRRSTIHVGDLRFTRTTESAG
jgi:hypothetical protein